MSRIKTKDLCERCAFCYDRFCHGKNCENCSFLGREEGLILKCNCNTVFYNTPCPYFKEHNGDEARHR